MLVDYRYEKFLNNLANPLQLNDMRTMKEDKYNDLRAVLSSFLGSPFLRLMKDHQEELELDPDVFDLVYEGFWDLYTFHPQIADVSARKLQGWIQKVKLTSTLPREVDDVASEKPAEDPKSDNDEEGKEAEPVEAKPIVDTTVEDIYDPIAAMVRIKIPKVPHEPEMDENGEEIIKEIDESELEDIPFADQCLSLITRNDEQRIWVVNHLAQKTLRQEISAELRQSVDRLDNLDAQDFNFRLEKESHSFEENLLRLMEDKPDNKSKAPKVPVFDFRPKYWNGLKIALLCTNLPSIGPIEHSP